METTQSIHLLDSIEQRVLGSLIEKSRTTPEYYPLTLNSLTTACNQKTSRKPVVNYDEDTVVAALDTLKRKGLVATMTGGTSRMVKYKHNLSVAYPLDVSEVVLIGLLLLRGPQTIGELNTNSGRMYEYESLEEIQTILDKLSSPELPFVVQLPKKAGQKEARFMHLFGGVPNVEDDEDIQPEMPVSRVSELENRLSKVETELAEMKEGFEKLMKELMG